MDKLEARGSSPAARWWLPAAYVALGVGLALFAYRGVWRATYNSVDFGLYYCSARAWLFGADPWSPESLRAIAQQADVHSTMLGNAVAPPFTFALLAPYAALPYSVARLSWLATNTLGVFGIILMLTRWVGLRWSCRSPPVIWIAAGVLLLAPIRTCVGFGQLAVASVALALLAFVTDHSGRPRLGALFYALAVLLKPQLALPLGVYWLLRRRWSLLVTAVATCVAIAALSAMRLYLAIPDWFDVWQANADRMLRSGIGDFTQSRAYIFINLDYAIHRLVGDRTLTQVLSAFIAGALSIVVAFRLRREIVNPPAAPEPRRELLIFGLIGVIGLLPIYHVYYDASILVLAVAWTIVAIGPGRCRLPVLVLLGLTGFAVPGAAVLASFARSGLLPDLIAESWWFTHLIMAYQPWLLLAIAVVMQFALAGRTSGQMLARGDPMVPPAGGGAGAPPKPT